MSINVEVSFEKEIEQIAVIGLGYVGLPVAVAFANKLRVIGFDVNTKKIEEYRNGIDVTGDLGDEVVRNSLVDFTSDEEKLEGVNFFIVAVPTPVQSGNVPDLTFVSNASKLIGRKLTSGAVVVYESTVYPGVTEDICIPILEEVSGLKCGVDFKVGYSPERINPGDKIHKLENIVKIVAGIDEEALNIIAKTYELIIEAGVHRAECIKVAEAAKVVENAQRDINIAFMNELAMLFNHMDIDTKAVLRAASTKWNFLDFSPGLVGGHCISIDPYYLTFKAEDTGYHSKIMLAARHINDGMGQYVAQHIMKIIFQKKKNATDVRIGLLGFAYKEDCEDFRNTKVIDIYKEFGEYGITPLVVDPLVDKDKVFREYGIEITDIASLTNLDVVILAVPHQSFLQMGVEEYKKLYNGNQMKIMIDIKGVIHRSAFENKGFYYWSL